MKSTDRKKVSWGDSHRDQNLYDAVTSSDRKLDVTSESKFQKSAAAQKEIRFFTVKGKFALFSNFASTPLTINAKEYQTVEHYFQSAKFLETDQEYAEVVRLAETPLEAKKLGQSREHQIHPEWANSRKGEGISVQIMRRALFSKALQNSGFKNLLLSTKNDEVLIEASPYDSFWGEGRNKTGKNMLGKLLMELREMLRSHIDLMYEGSAENIYDMPTDDEGAGDNANADDEVVEEDE